jgi:fatty acid desaturase
MDTQTETKNVILGKTHPVMAQFELKVYLHQSKPWLNILVILYTLVSYYGGIALLLRHNVWLNIMGTILVSHGLIYGAFLGHELLHGSVFKKQHLNKLIAGIIRWITGMCYVPFHQAARGHIGHHLGLKSKFKGKSLTASLLASPKPVLTSLVVLEWCYFPIVTFLYLWWRNLAPFRLNQPLLQKLRVMFLLLVRGTMFTLLGMFSFKALSLYFLAYILMITIARFNQAFEHTSSYKDDPESRISFTTFSPVISKRYPWLDILVLNFSYHNAHHVMMSCPWYHLPTLDRHIFQGSEQHHLAWTSLLRNYHCFRITRLFSVSGSAVTQQGSIDLENFYGVQAALPF